MASTETTGAAASMKAEKASRESLAKKKSSVKAELEKVAAELEEIEQLKAEAEDLEDEEMLNEMQAEERRLQGLKQQYAAELASIQEQQQAAQQALRQRFRRLTGERAALGSSNASLGSSSTDLGASGKSTFSEASTAQPAAAALAANESALPQAASPAASSTYIAQAAAPFTSGMHRSEDVPLSSDALHTSENQSPTADTAQSDAGQYAYSGPSAMSNQPLSASWGTPAPDHSIMLDQSQHAHGYGDVASAAYSQQGSQQSNQEPFSASAIDSSLHISRGADHEAPHTPSASLDTVPASTVAEAAGQEAEANKAHLQAAESVAPGGSDQSMGRNTADLSKPPRPASSSIGQQGIAKPGNVGQQPSGLGMHDRTGSKASMLSAGSGYQADSDSNSDVQVEPQRASLNLSSPPSPTRTDAPGVIHTRTAQDSGEDEVQAAEADTQETASTPTSMLGKIGNSVWGAVEAITGHPADSSESAADSKPAAQSTDIDQHLHGVVSPSANQQADASHKPTESTSAAPKEAELTQVDSGYEAGEEGPVQAGPEGLSQHAPGSAAPNSDAEYRSNGFESSPAAIRTSMAPQQDSVSVQPETGPDSISESAATADAQQGYSPSAIASQQPLHVHTDPASSKRGISGVGDEQPVSASKRPRGDSSIARLINTFDSPKSEPISPGLSSRGSGSVGGRRYFSGSTFNEGQGGFTQGVSPTQDRASSSNLASNQGGSPFSGSNAYGSQAMTSQGSRTLPEEDSYLQSTRASQGSIDTNRDFALGSVGSLGNRSELTNEPSEVRHLRGFSGSLPESAAELTLPGGTTPGAAAGSSAISSLPPSASWGSAPAQPSSLPTPTPTYTPPITPPTLAEQLAETNLSEEVCQEAQPEFNSSTQSEHGTKEIHAPTAQGTGFDQTLPDTDSNRQSAADVTAQDGVADYNSEIAAAPAYDGSRAGFGDESFEQQFKPAVQAPGAGLGQTAQAGFADQAFEEPTQHAQREQGSESAFLTQQPGLGQTAQEGFADQSFEQPTQHAQSEQISEPVYQTEGPRFDETSQQGFAASKPEQHAQQGVKGYTAQDTMASPAVQDSESGFNDDAFAQFSPFAKKGSQQANPFGQDSVASPVAQAPVLQSSLPSESSVKEQVGLPSEQVTPPSAEGPFTGRTPFQSGRPGAVATQRLDSQQSLDVSPGSGKVSPRRRPPPPPRGSQPAVARAPLALPPSPTQTSAASAMLGTREVGVQQPASSSVARQKDADSSLLTGKSAFESAKPEASTGLAQESAFGRADASIGADFATSGSQANAAPKSEPLSSWFSFEDPGPLPPMPTPTVEEDTPIDPKGTSPQPPTASFAEPAVAKQPETQPSIDAWATPVEPSAETKATEKEVLASSLAGLDGDAWGGSSFGPDMGQPMGAAEPTGKAADTSAKGKSADISVKGTQDSTAASMAQPEPMQSQPSWMQLASSSNPFSQFLPLDSSAADPNPWAATPTPTPAGSQQIPAKSLAAGPGQDVQQQKPAGFGSWNSFEQPAPVTYPAIDNSRHPDASKHASQQPAAAVRAEQQQRQQEHQYPAPPTGLGAQQPAGSGQDWAAFGPGGQAAQVTPHQQPASSDDIWSSLDRNQPPQQQRQEPRAAIVDSWASFDAPSEAPGLGAPVASQQTSQGMSNINSQDSWSAFDPGNNSGARSRAGASATAANPPSSASSTLQQQAPPSGYGSISQRTLPDRKNSIEEIPVQDLELEGLTITAQPKPGTSQSQSYGHPQGSSSQGPAAQPLPKPKRGSSNQFGSVFAPGSANSVSKLTNMFKKDKDKKVSQSMDASQFEQQGTDAGAIGPASQGPPSLPLTPSRKRGQASQGQGQFSEVDQWRPQSAEERQQCMNAFDHKGYGRLGGLGETEARALWTRQNMPADSFQQVWHLSDMDNNQLLSKPEFCLFMYLMHALRNFGSSFHLPEHITPPQAAKILGLEGFVRGGGSGGASPSSQGYNPAQAYAGNGNLQGPQQGSQQGGSNDWEATGGLSPSQQQAVQELSDLGFNSQQSQEALEAHRWNRNAAANWLLQGGSNQSQGGSSLPPTPLRRTTTDRSSYPPSLASTGSGAGSQSLRHTGSGIGRFSHGHTGSAGSTADWGSGNYSPTSTGGYSQPGSARTTGDSIPGTGVQFGSPGSTPRSSSRVPATGNARLSLTVRKTKMDYRGIMEKPFFTLSIRARGGKQLELSQDTPPGIFANGVMHSDHTLMLSTPIEKIPQGSVLFFELKHWKPKEKKFSLRGWALVAVSSLVDYSGSVPQLQTGTMKLSMLQKPVDLALSRKHKRLSPEGFDLEVNVNVA